MTRGLYLSYRDAEDMAAYISAETRLTTTVTEYEEKDHWFYVTAYDEDGHAVDEVDTYAEALELIKAYRED